MSDQTLRTIEKIRQQVKEQEDILHDTRLTGTPEEIQKQENIVASFKRQLDMLEKEARFGH